MAKKVVDLSLPFPPLVLVSTVLRRGQRWANVGINDAWKEEEEEEARRDVSFGEMAGQQQERMDVIK